MAPSLILEVSFPLNPRRVDVRSVCRPASVHRVDVAVDIIAAAQRQQEEEAHPSGVAPSVAVDRNPPAIPPAAGGTRAKEHAHRHTGN